MNVKKLRFYVAGGGTSGVFAAKLLVKYGAQVYLGESGTLPFELKKSLEEDGVFIQIGELCLQDDSPVDFLVLSPGIPLTHSVVCQARQLGIPIVSEVEIASWFLPSSSYIIGITGTNGKSTTTSYIAKILERYFHSYCKPCGNIGTSLSEIIYQEINLKHYVVELSSYQLETTYSLHPDISIFINIQTDHLLRYKTIEEYFKAKWRLILLTKENGLCILDHKCLKKALNMGLALPNCQMIVVTPDDENLSKHKTIGKKLDRLKIKDIWCDLRLPYPSYSDLAAVPLEIVFQSKNKIQFCKLKYDSLLNGASVKWGVTHWEIKKSCLYGEHNSYNILFASLAAQHCGVSENIILEQWEISSSTFEPLPHRLEIVNINDTADTLAAGQKKVTLINDSKATNVESTIVAVKSFRGHIRLLLGGEPKGEMYDQILMAFDPHSCYFIYCFGKAATLIYNTFFLSKMKSNVFLINIYTCLENAVVAAWNDSESEDIILFSPACSSFDEFKNFEERGYFFKQCLKRLATHQPTKLVSK